MNTLSSSYSQFPDFPLSSSSHPPPPPPPHAGHQPHHSPITPSAGPGPAPPTADQLLSSTEQDHFMSFLADNFGTSANFDSLDPNPGVGGGLGYPLPGQEYGAQNAMHYPAWGAPPPPPPPGAGPSGYNNLPPPPPPPSMSHSQSAPSLSSQQTAPGQLPPISTLTSLSSTASNPSLSRPLLSNTQKRENHIQSEQRRRNQIRQSYALLSLLLEGPEAGPGSNPALKGTSGMSREMIFGGQVKGKKGRARGGGKKQGKAGTLFRAVEYVRWLSEGNEQLVRDVGELRERVGRWQQGAYRGEGHKPGYVY